MQSLGNHQFFLVAMRLPSDFYSSVNKTLVSVQYTKIQKKIILEN